MARSAMKGRLAVLGLVALGASGCTKTDVTSRDTTAANTPVTANADSTTNAPEKLMNAYPDVDLELITDYGRPEADPMRRSFRIHMDIPVADASKFKRLQTALDAGKQNDVYGAMQEVVKDLKPGGPSTRGRALIDAALKPMPK